MRRKYLLIMIIIIFSLCTFGNVLSNTYLKPPSKVTNVRLNLIGIYVNIIWDPSMPGDNPIAGYEIFRGETKSNMISIGKVNENTHHYLDTTVRLNETYYYMVKCFDRFSNYSEPSEILSITITDKNPPDLTILEPEVNNLYTKEDEVRLLVGVRDYESGLKDLRVNGEKINRCGCSTFSKTLTLKEGKNEFIIEAVDHAGNKATEILVIYKDTKPPEIDVNIPKEVSNENLVIKGKVSDTVSGVKFVKVNGITVEFDEEGYFETIILLKEGETTVVIDAVDNLDNEIKEEFVVNLTRLEIKLFIGKSYFYVNNDLGKMDVPPLIIDGRTFVPVRFIVEGIGGEITWNGKEKNVEIEYMEKRIKLWIDKEISLVDGKEVFIDKSLKIKPFILNGRTMVPIRFIAEIFGFSVSWNPVERSVILKLS